MIRRAISHEGIIYQMQSRLALGWEMQDRRLWISVVKNIDISISIDTEISERYQY